MPIDLDGEARLRDGDKNGSVVVDMGAYDFQPQHQLVVTKSGSGDGTVTSSPAGISCGAICSAYFIEESAVTLTAVADLGSFFSGWSGDCAGSSDYEITLDSIRNVKAIFKKFLYHSLSNDHAKPGLQKPIFKFISSCN